MTIAQIIIVLTGVAFVAFGFTKVRLGPRIGTYEGLMSAMSDAWFRGLSAGIGLAVIFAVVI